MCNTYYLYLSFITRLYNTVPSFLQLVLSDFMKEVVKHGANELKKMSGKISVKTYTIQDF